VSEHSVRIIEDALRLPVEERVLVVERLLSSLDQPDPRIRALWAEEAEARLTAYEAGRMAAVPADEVFAELDRL
jgi:putative addiction module component (TIGR02574 family)